MSILDSRKTGTKNEDKVDDKFLSPNLIGYYIKSKK